MAAALPVGLMMANWVSVLDTFVGAVTAGFLTRSTQSGDKTLIVRALESRLAVMLGGFSYSLYLTHYPILAGLTAALVRLGVPPSARLALLLTAGTALCLAVAYAFHLAFERPFLAAHTRPGSPWSGDGTSDRQAPAEWPRHHRPDPDHRDPTRPPRGTWGSDADTPRPDVRAPRASGRDLTPADPTACQCRRTDPGSGAGPGYRFLAAGWLGGPGRSGTAHRGRAGGVASPTPLPGSCRASRESRPGEKLVSALLPFDTENVLRPRVLP